ncbi:DUF106 domain-containing protein [Candidatus Woesearchaeota archaeon]|jgi:uncharacterized membrane protein (DUF106 family)|nr:DUF106 domain-containing protein [Candidatus Woesearchaeota archaeon]MBT4321715.1 DUF106 domain-containing protein [Candidatus Woesearchaeota archaeon]MBT4631193.1 DUF106 domain-containing protein [Candidatus Woesearchaeota archaeon]
MVLESFFNSIFGWAIDISPRTGIIVVSFVMTLVATLIHKFMTDQTLLKNIKEEMKQIRKEIKEAAQDPAKMAELNKKSMEKSMTQMKHTLKPIIITMVVFFILFSWLRDKFDPLQVDFLFIHSWFWVYFVFAILFSLILRKILKVH